MRPIQIGEIDVPHVTFGPMGHRNRTTYSVGDLVVLNNTQHAHDVKGSYPHDVPPWSIWRIERIVNRSMSGPVNLYESLYEAHLVHAGTLMSEESFESHLTITNFNALKRLELLDFLNVRARLDVICRGLARECNSTPDDGTMNHDE